MVLVVDDDADIRNMAVALLGLHGIAATSVANGVVALRELSSMQPKPDVILLDVQMPELDGWDTLQAIRSRADLASVRVILCTVKASLDDVGRGVALGCDGYLAKPFSVDELVAEVSRVGALPRRESASTVSDAPL